MILWLLVIYCIVILYIGIRKIRKSGRVYVIFAEALTAFFLLYAIVSSILWKYNIYSIKSSILAVFVSSIIIAVIFLIVSRKAEENDKYRFQFKDIIFLLFIILITLLSLGSVSVIGPNSKDGILQNEVINLLCGQNQVQILDGIKSVGVTGYLSILMLGSELFGIAHMNMIQALFVLCILLFFDEILYKFQLSFCSRILLIIVMGINPAIIWNCNSYSRYLLLGLFAIYLVYSVINILECKRYAIHKIPSKTFVKVVTIITLICLVGTTIVLVVINMEDLEEVVWVSPVFIFVITGIISIPIIEYSFIFGKHENDITDYFLYLIANVFYYLTIFVLLNAKILEPSDISECIPLIIVVNILFAKMMTYYKIVDANILCAMIAVILFEPNTFSIKQADSRGIIGVTDYVEIVGLMKQDTDNTVVLVDSEIATLFERSIESIGIESNIIEDINDLYLDIIYGKYENKDLLYISKRDNEFLENYSNEWTKKEMFCEENTNSKFKSLLAPEYTENGQINVLKFEDIQREEMFNKFDMKKYEPCIVDAMMDSEGFFQATVDLNIPNGELLINEDNVRLAYHIYNLEGTCLAYCGQETELGMLIQESYVNVLGKIGNGTESYVITIDYIDNNEDWAELKSKGTTVILNQNGGEYIANIK